MQRLIGNSYTFTDDNHSAIGDSKSGTITFEVNANLSARINNNALI
jgi:hypothetical protein